MAPLKQLLSLPERGIISVIGGGGKTSVIAHLTDEFCREGKTVLCTTTTHIAALHPVPPWVVLEEEGQALDFAQIRKLLARYRVVTCAKKSQNPQKFSAPSDQFFAQAETLADIVLIEADGARHLPFKAPAEHEPVILAHTKHIIGVAGMDAAGVPILQRCHRPEQVCAILGCSPQDILTPQMMAEVIVSPLGYQKCVDHSKAFSLVLNKCDTLERISMAQQILSSLRLSHASFPVAFTSLHQDKIIDPTKL